MIFLTAWHDNDESTFSLWKNHCHTFVKTLSFLIIVIVHSQNTFCSVLMFDNEMTVVMIAGAFLYALFSYDIFADLNLPTTFCLLL